MSKCTAKFLADTKADFIRGIMACGRDHMLSEVLYFTGPAGLGVAMSRSDEEIASILWALRGIELVFLERGTRPGVA